MIFELKNKSGKKTHTRDNRSDMDNESWLALFSSLAERLGRSQCEPLIMRCNRIPSAIMPVSVPSAQASLVPPLHVSLSCSCFLSDGLFFSDNCKSYKRRRLCSASAHLKMLLSGRVKGCATPLRHQSNFSGGRDEITVYLDGSYVRPLSLCGNYGANGPPHIPFIHQCWVNSW